jgi:predicted DCC family thiol-disulfide oxidoreductase YuxK
MLFCSAIVRPVKTRADQELLRKLHAAFDVLRSNESFWRAVWALATAPTPLLQFAEGPEAC